ncbi:MAG: hypothetical protein WC659_01430 [Patescibacteria group bacterium]
MPLSKSWRLKHKMPNPPAGGPTEAQRLRWRLAHAKRCACKPIPDSLKKELMKKREKN